MPESILIVSPLRYVLSTMCAAKFPNSEGSPNLCGNCVDSNSGSLTLSGANFIKGVSKIPGAIVFTRIACLAKSLAAVSVKPMTPAFEALYAD